MVSTVFYVPDICNNVVAVRPLAIDLGYNLLNAKDQLAAEQASLAVEVSLSGHRVLIVNATTHISEIGHHLAKGRPFGVTWFAQAAGAGNPPKAVVSLRSDDNGLDVSEIAKKHGGGGHMRAAGFTMSLAEMTEWLRCGWHG